MKTHYLRLTARPFAAITTGKKTIETRLFDEKRQKIAVGDRIVFHNTEDTSQTITVLVTGLYKHATFRELFSSHKPEEFGGASVEQLIDQIYTFYSKEDEIKYGVVGIEIKIEQF